MRTIPIAPQLEKLLRDYVVRRQDRLVEIIRNLVRIPRSAISKAEPLVSELRVCAATVLGEEPPVVSIEGPCDMYVFHQAFGIPAVLWGGRGGNTHAAGEYLEIDSAEKAADALPLFACSWCGVADVS
jgi:acetylornithine deacetylase